MVIKFFGESTTRPDALSPLMLGAKAFPAMRLAEAREKRVDEGELRLGWAEHTKSKRTCQKN
jgi:hypothetical protein